MLQPAAGVMQRCTHVSRGGLAYAVVLSITMFDVVTVLAW